MLFNAVDPTEKIFLFLAVGSIDAVVFLLAMRPLIAIIPWVRSGPTASTLGYLVDMHLYWFRGVMENHFGRRIHIVFAWLAAMLVFFGIRYILMLMAVSDHTLAPGVVF